MMIILFEEIFLKYYEEKIKLNFFFKIFLINYDKR